MKEVLAVLLCYLIGSIPFSYIFSQLLGGVDIRTRGSHNVGATNVLRTVGIGVALTALAGDVSKGIAAAWIGSFLGGADLTAVCSIAVVVGHCWPIFLRFRGGKGVATAAGVVLFLMPKLIPPLVLLFILIIVITRYVSLSSICVAVCLPPGAMITGEPRSYIIMSVIIAVMVIQRHHENINKLRNGSESRINERA